MRILFAIQNVRGLNTGFGGHYHSLVATAHALRGSLQCTIVTLGDQQSSAFANIDVPHRHVWFNGRNVASALNGLLSVVRDIQPDVIHSFDVNSFFFARLASLRTGVGVVNTKCGGPPPRVYYPLAEELIVYTDEDRRYFGQSRRHARCRVHVIPNRVSEVKVDKERTKRLREMVRGQGAVILRIGRFASEYRDTLLQAVRLVRDLRDDGIQCHLLAVGTGAEESVVADVRAAGGAHVTVVTDPEFTQNASELVEAGDLVVGTGRSFMEASARGRVVLTPISNGPHPVLVTRDNFKALFASNFSPRNALNDHRPRENYESIARIIRDPVARGEASTFARILFEDNFLIDHVVPRFIGIYDEARKRGRGILLRPAGLVDMGLHAVRLIKSVRRAAGS